MMGGVNKHARAVADRIPNGSEGVELGVWRGDTAETLLGRARHLHLVDAWSLDVFDVDGLFLRRYEHIVGAATREAFGAYYEGVHAAVVERFRGRSVTIHRMTTTRWLDQFEGPPLDFAYVDAGHDYASVLSDTLGALAVARQVMGDDWGNKPGVRPAVEEAARRVSGRVEVFAVNQWEIVR